MGPIENALAHYSHVIAGKSFVSSRKSEQPLGHEGGESGRCERRPRRKHRRRRVAPVLVAQSALLAGHLLGVLVAHGRRRPAVRVFDQGRVQRALAGDRHLAVRS